MEMTDAGGSVVVEEARWWKGVGMEGVWRAGGGFHLCENQERG